MSHCYNVSYQCQNWCKCNLKHLLCKERTLQGVGVTSQLIKNFVHVFIWRCERYSFELLYFTVMNTYNVLYLVTYQNEQHIINNLLLVLFYWYTRKYDFIKLIFILCISFQYKNKSCVTSIFFSTWCIISWIKFTSNEFCSFCQMNWNVEKRKIVSHSSSCFKMKI